MAVKKINSVSLPTTYLEYVTLAQSLERAGLLKIYLKPLTLFFENIGFSFFTLYLSLVMGFCF